MTAGEMEILLMVGVLDVNRSAEALLVNMYFNIKVGDMRGGDGSGKSDRIMTIEVLKEKEKGIMTMSSQQEDIINNNQV